MPATIADIAAGSRESVVASWADAAVALRYPSARDGAAEPDEGYFDAITDATTLVQERSHLLGVERRRFAVKVADILWPTVSTGIPTVTLRDVEQGADGSFLVSRIEVDLETETTNLELFG